MPDVAENLAEIRARILAACIRSGRVEDSVQLIAVSKTFPAESVRDAVAAGHLHFGESRIQEAEGKIAALPGNLHWHFIGRLQRNKVRKALANFEVIHAVDSSALALHMDSVAKEMGLFPKVFLQVNIAGEESKGGFEPGQLCAELEPLLQLERVEMIGFMCIPPAAANPEAARPWFVALRELRDRLAAEIGANLPALSMGMSGDFEIAIEEGATHVRVGSAIFGKRAYRVDGELG